MSHRLFALMRQFTIRFRMYAAIGVVLVLLLLVGGAGIFGMFRIHQISGKVINESLEAVDRVSKLRLEMALARQHEKDMIIQYEQPERVAETRTRWDASATRIEQALNELSQTLQGEQKDQITKAMEHFKQYHNLFAHLSRQIESSVYDTATAANRMSMRAVGELTATDKALTQLDEALRVEAKDANTNRNDLLDNMLFIFAGLVVVSLLIVVPLTLLNMRAICQPVELARQLSQSIASGDLTQSQQAEGRDEVADLLRALEQMRSELAGMVGQLRDAGESIATASREIATGNHDLSTRTEQTASNVQQTVSSISGLTGHVQHTASAAQNANQLVASATQSAQRGGKEMEEAVQSMYSISTSGKKIADIVAVIDGIAFQTNILALNAAVEAARAGEQGRGFAVVAGEVRSLAGRSAEAAKEIKRLIDASVSAIDGGARQVEAAGAAMQEIVSGVQRVRDIMGEITTAADSQSHGIGQVDQAVQEIDRMTQQNAALVEESTAAAESMREQADRLADIVRQFRLASSGMGRSAPGGAVGASARPLLLTS
ncbi:methyl-accepting chemotaxis protein [Hylemonella gracilis]|uniref:Methyl-accepting chemotaxis sensory transducer n=1 Tax=Hylemonella gracilis ATCC 19624 TaxID=887062 RepID=F3KRJ0_9BURK|nr:methyl-accepting chemotaxis protein [Hylemonella gracilis]EGI77589.1 methyl-accepting chemotaxis sensory transducer [Hylemonella gracilis ATCC 19624]